ncbi:DUF1702 family protein [Micromonospora sp. WMMA1998]|uniref:DUF1702 family protein n=1 Tax=Micromonospora sp. WMMA1998 TaxID=3015167 RepID=UPI00248B8C39|nr:DUF1702 family protein [Micromonospora sp. WMMA1998]WBC14941.1 DUF1702 family protein [Micromonospora sp. WMMA1998]
MRPLFEVTPKDLPELPAEDNATTRRLKQVVYTVTECCQLALLHSRFDRLVPRLDAYDDELRGFAYEGAGVGLAALDTMLPWRHRTRDFVAGPGGPYRQAIYLGAGMGLARIRRDPEPLRAGLADPVFSWVVLDGYGFHEGFFRHRQYVRQRRVPSKLRGYALRAFDHGLGRSIWFATGARIEAVRATIGTFTEPRQRDLWGGVGLACGYTGGVDRATVERVPAAAGRFRADLAVGVAIAAKARQEVGNPALHNEDACEVVWGRSSREVTRIAEAALDGLLDGADGDPVPAYERWRRRIRAQAPVTTTARDEPRRMVTEGDAA